MRGFALFYTSTEAQHNIFQKLSLSRQRVEPGVSRGILVFNKLRIHLCGGYIGVTQHFLNILKLRAVFKQMRRKRMAQSVRGYILFNSRLFGIMFYNFPKALAGH